MKNQNLEGKINGNGNVSDWRLLKAIAATELNELYDGIKKAGKNLSSMSAARKAAYLFGVGVPAMVMQANCGGSGGSHDQNSPAQPADSNDADYVRPDFNDVGNYLLLITNVESDINEAQPYLGNASVADAQDIGMTNSAFKDSYNLDSSFREDIRALYRPLMQALIQAQQGKTLTDDQLNAEIDSFISNLTDNMPTCLDNVNLGNGNLKVLMGKVNVDGADRYFLAYRLIDQDSNPYLLVTVGGLHTPMGAHVGNDPMKTLYDYINESSEEGF